MAYQTGAATSINDLIQQLAAWLETRGWTLDASQADGTGWRAHLHKSGWFVHLKTTVSGGPWNFVNFNPYSNPGPVLWAYMSTGFAGMGSNWNLNITGAPLLSGTSSAGGVGLLLNNGGQSSYHFFDDGNDHYIIVVERTEGIFGQIGFGFSMTKHGGNWTGGAYLHGQSQGRSCGDAVAITDSGRCPFSTNDVTNNDVTGFVRADVDAFVDKWLSCGLLTDPIYGYTGKKLVSSVAGRSSYDTVEYSVPHTATLRARLTSIANSQAVLLPIRLYAARDAGGYSLIATVPSVYQINAVGNGYANESEIQLGADTYKLFKDFAVKKVP